MNSKLENLIGQVAETNQKVGDFPVGHQVIITRILSEWYDPHLEVEQRGRHGSVHLSEIRLLKAKFEILN
jgi:hypothetical protein